MIESSLIVQCGIVILISSSVSLIFAFFTSRPAVTIVLYCTRNLFLLISGILPFVLLNTSEMIIFWVVSSAASSSVVSSGILSSFGLVIYLYADIEPTLITTARITAMITFHLVFIGFASLLLYCLISCVTLYHITLSFLPDIYSI